MVKEAFLKHNIELPNRPLMLLRDLETVSRFINVITTTTRFYERAPYCSVINASDEDVHKAIDLWETIIDLRKTLYTGTEREILSVKEKVFREIMEMGRVKTRELEKIIVDAKNLCSRATFYRKINELRSEGKIGQDGLRDSDVYPA